MAQKTEKKKKKSSRLGERNILYFPTARIKQLENSLGNPSSKAEEKRALSFKKYVHDSKVMLGFDIV